MTKQELIDLEVERQALLHTVKEMSKGDARMQVSLNEMLSELEDRAQQIKKLIDQELNKQS